jgi:hypothetical protein
LRARQQAKAQREWAQRNAQTFLNGFDMFRDYATAVANGMMNNDQIHPSVNGHAFKNLMLWQRLPLAGMNLGVLFNLNVAGGNATLAGVITPTDIINNVGGVVEFGRTIRIAGTLSAINFGTQDVFDNPALDVPVRNLSGSLAVGSSCHTGTSSFLGWHPAFNAATLGGRGNFWWNVGAAGLRTAYVATAADLTVTGSNHTIHITGSGTPVITLPDAVFENASLFNYTNTQAGIVGKMYVVKNSSTGSATVRGNSVTRGSGVTNGTTAITYANIGNAPNVGDLVTGTDIPANTYMVTAGLTSGTMSNAATGSSSGLTFTFRESINSLAELVLTSGQSAHLQSTGAGWITF